MPSPAILEAYNVTEPLTEADLKAGGSGQATVIGNMLADTAMALGGTVAHWQPVWDGSTHHLRVHVVYP